MKNKNFYGKGISAIEGTDWKFNKNVSNNFDKHVRQSIPMYDQIQKIHMFIKRMVLKRWFKYLRFRVLNRRNS